MGKGIAMELSHKQAGVFKGMMLALLTSAFLVALGILLDPFACHQRDDIDHKLTVLGLSMILPTMTLIVAIGRLARFRFFSPADIDGSGLTKGSAEATILQSLLQNTLEQLVIATGVYTAWCLVMPAAWLSAVPLSSLAFTVGRLGFFKGYHKGAPSRAFGFALTFYPTVLLMVVLLVYVVVNFLR